MQNVFFQQQYSQYNTFKLKKEIELKTWRNNTKNKFKN